VIGLTFSLDQVKSAPPEVRRWIEREAAAALAALSRPEPGPSHTHAGALSACTVPEAAEVYELIKSNFLLSQVFFELAREMPSNHATMQRPACSASVNTGRSGSTGRPKMVSVNSGSIYPTANH
jgi:hypothetical protein